MALGYDRVLEQLIQTELLSARSTVIDLLNGLRRNPGDAVKEADARRTRPIHLAAATGNGALIELMAKYGVDLHAVDVKGQTALSIAAKSASFEVVAVRCHPDH